MNNIVFLQNSVTISEEFFRDFYFTRTKNEVIKETDKNVEWQ